MRALLFVAVAACDPVWSLDVAVTTRAGAPLQDAALVLTGCPRQNEHDLGTPLAVLTDVDGVASVAGLGFEYPPCRVTVAKPGYVTWQSSFYNLCRRDLENCYPIQHRDLALDAAP